MPFIRQKPPVKTMFLQTAYTHFSGREFITLKKELAKFVSYSSTFPKKTLKFRREGFHLILSFGLIIIV